MADYALDLHSGGSSLFYLPCTLFRDDGSEQQVADTFTALKAFGGSLAYVTDGRNQGAGRTFHAAASRQGVVVITTELGGGATVDPAGLRLAEEGIRRFLHHVGLLKEVPPPSVDKLRLMTVEGPGSYLLAPEDGIFEPVADLTAEVRTGDQAGWIHFPATPWRESQAIFFKTSGAVVCKRAMSTTRRGDCLYQVLIDYKCGLPGSQI